MKTKLALFLLISQLSIVIGQSNEHIIPIDKKASIISKTISFEDGGTCILTCRSNERHNANLLRFDKNGDMLWNKESYLTKGRLIGTPDGNFTYTWFNDNIPQVLPFIPINQYNSTGVRSDLDFTKLKDDGMKRGREMYCDNNYLYFLAGDNDYRIKHEVNSYLYIFDHKTKALVANPKICTLSGASGISIIGDNEDSIFLYSINLESESLFEFILFTINKNSFEVTENRFNLKISDYIGNSYLKGSITTISKSNHETLWSPSYNNGDEIAPNYIPHSTELFCANLVNNNIVLLGLSGFKKNNPTTINQFTLSLEGNVIDNFKKEYNGPYKFSKLTNESIIYFDYNTNSQNSNYGFVSLNENKFSTASVYNTKYNSAYHCNAIHSRFGDRISKLISNDMVDCAIEEKFVFILNKKGNLISITM